MFRTFNGCYFVKKYFNFKEVKFGQSQRFFLSKIFDQNQSFIQLKSVSSSKIFAVVQTYTILKISIFR